MAVAVPGAGADDAAPVGTGWSGASDGRDSRRAGRDDRGRMLADLPPAGPRLRRGCDGGGVLRLHARQDGERHGEHGSARRSIRTRAARVSRGADGRRFLHRFHQRDHHYDLPEHMELNRDEAWALLTEHTKGESLLKHAMAVEAAVRGYARKFGEDEEAWGITALLHDFDYERWPTLGDHPNT